MKSRDAARASLDASADAIASDARAADELFAVVDLLESQHTLRRSLSDPSGSPEERAALAKRLFGSRISAPASAVLDLVVRAAWPSGRRLVEAVERQGVRALLRGAKASGELARVQAEIHTVATTVTSNPELSDALRNRAYPLESRRELLARLTAGKVSPTTTVLLRRAAAARLRTVPLTIDSYLEMAAGLGNERVAKVTVARPLDEARLERLRRALVAQVGGPVAMQVQVDPSVIGGVNVQLGDDVIESTVAGRLEDARRLLHTT